MYSAILCTKFEQPTAPSYLDCFVKELFLPTLSLLSLFCPRQLSSARHPFLLYCFLKTQLEMHLLLRDWLRTLHWQRKVGRDREEEKSPEKSPAPGRIWTHNFKSFAPQACALPLRYNCCQNPTTLASDKLTLCHLLSSKWGSQVELERVPDPAWRLGPEEMLVVNEPNTRYPPGPNLSQPRELFCRLGRARVLAVFTMLE